MGLNVYFCDVCGVRVTDVDLRSGHGMLRGQDVICATCLEMGHGKEWLASRGVSASAASVSVASVGAPSSASKFIDHARDRAMTVEDHPAQAVVEEVSLDEPAEIDEEDTGVAADRRHAVEADSDELLDPVFAKAETPAPSSGPSSASRRESTSDFAGAAASFAALGSSSPVAEEDDDEDVEVEASSEVDPSLLRSGSTAGSQETDEVVGASALSRSAGVAGKGSGVRGASKSRSDRLRRSVSGARPGAGSGNRPAVGKKTSSSSVAALPKGPSAVQSSSKSASSRIVKPKSGRSKRASAIGGIPLPLKISLITIPLILLIGLGTYVGPQLMRGSREPDVKDLQAQQAWIQTAFAQTTAIVNSAANSKDLKTLQAANEAWLKFNNDLDRFCQSAKQYSKWTDENCEIYSSQTLKVMDVAGRMKLVRDEMVKQQMQSR